MATQVETLLHSTSTPTPSPLLQEEDLQPPAEHGALTPEPSSQQAEEESSLQGGETVEEKKQFREAPPPKVNPWTKKLNSGTVNGQTAPGELPQHWPLYSGYRHKHTAVTVPLRERSSSGSCHSSASIPNTHS